MSAGSGRAMDGAFVPKLAAKARVTFDRHEQKHMLMYPERGLVLNDTAKAIVDKLDGTRSVDAIAVELAAAFDTTADAIRGDVIAFVTMLRDRGLLA